MFSNFHEVFPFLLSFFSSQNSPKHTIIINAVNYKLHPVVHIFQSNIVDMKTIESNFTITKSNFLASYLVLIFMRLNLKKYVSTLISYLFTYFCFSLLFIHLFLLLFTYFWFLIFLKENCSFFSFFSFF